MTFASEEIRKLRTIESIKYCLEQGKGKTMLFIGLKPSVNPDIDMK